MRNDPCRTPVMSGLWLASIVRPASAMPPPRRLARFVSLALTVALLAWTYGAIVEPWSRNWGATVEETQWSLPGDDIVDAPTAQTTRALTIVAPIEHVWPWLAQ